MIALSSLLERRELGLRLVAGAAPDAVQVLEAEVCDLPDPRPWLGPGSMLLTTGVALGHGAHAQRLLVDRVAQSGAVAIGFAVGLAHADVPAGIREGCERSGPALVAVPPGCPLRLVAEAVGDPAGSHRLEQAQRILTMQSHLMDALAAPEPEAELLRRLGSLLGGTALLADEAGAVLGAPAAALPDELWGPLRGSKGIGLHHLRGRRYVTAPVSDRVGARRWIVVVGDPGALPDGLARQGLQTAERLVRLVDRARPPRPAEARAVRAELAEELLGFRPMGERRLLARRAAALGIGVDGALQVAVLRPGSAATPREARVQQAARVHGEVESQLSAREVPFLLTHRGDDVVVVAPDGLAALLRGGLDALADPGLALDAGVGRAVATLDGLPRSLLDARFAVEQLRRDGDGDDLGDGRGAGGAGRRRLLAHADLDLATALVCDADPAVAAPRQAALLGRVTAHDLRQTLLAYLDHGLDVPRTAAALHLHANSLRYRLGRIEDQLGRSLRDPGTIANLYLAVLLERAAGRDGDPPPGAR